MECSRTSRANKLKLQGLSSEMKPDFLLCKVDELVTDEEEKASLTQPGS